MNPLKLWGSLSSVFITLVIGLLIGFVAIHALEGFSLTLIFGNTPPWDALKGSEVWDGLWTPLKGTLKLLALSGCFAVPMGFASGIYITEYMVPLRAGRIVILLEALAGLPSIIVGLFGFVLILFLRRFFFPASTGLLLSAFCLSVLVLPLLALNTVSALKGLPDSLRVTAASLGLTKEVMILVLLIPAAAEGLISGLMAAAGRCAEDTAVILLTGAVAVGRGGGLTDKFEALPFFIYYMSANYQDGAQLAQVFAACLMLLFLTFILLIISRLLKRRSL